MPGGKGNIRSSDGRPFTTENQPANRGRKVKVFSQIAQEWKARGIERATPDVVVEAFEYLLALPFSELKDLSKGVEENPSIIQIAAEEMIGKRKREILGDMLDRAHGKAISRQEHTGKAGEAIEFNFENLSTAELKTFVSLTQKAEQTNE